VMFSNQPMIVLLYKEALLNTNELDPVMPSFVVSLLQEFEDVFPDEMLHCLPPIRGIEHQIDFAPMLPFQIDQLIGAILTRRRSFKGRLVNC
jgi:hypothetical protein